MFWICAENSIDTTGRFLVLHRSAYIVAKTFLASCPTPPASGLGVHKISEETWPGQLTQTHQWDIPYLMASCSVYRVDGEEGIKKVRGYLK